MMIIEESFLRFFIAVRCCFKTFETVSGLLFFKMLTTDAHMVALEFWGRLKIPFSMFAMKLETGMDLGVVAKLNPGFIRVKLTV